MEIRDLVVWGAAMLPVIAGASFAGYGAHKEYREAAREASQPTREIRGTLGYFHREFRPSCGPLVIEIKGEDGKRYRARFHTNPWLKPMGCDGLDAAENELRSPQFKRSGEKVKINGNIFVENGDVTDVFYGMGRGQPHVYTGDYQFPLFGFYR